MYQSNLLSPSPLNSPSGDMRLPRPDLSGECDLDRQPGESVQMVHMPKDWRATDQQHLLSAAGAQRLPAREGPRTVLLPLPGRSVSGTVWDYAKF